MPVVGEVVVVEEVDLVFMVEVGGEVVAVNSRNPLKLSGLKHKTEVRNTILGEAGGILKRSVGFLVRMKHEVFEGSRFWFGWPGLGE